MAWNASFALIIYFSLILMIAWHYHHKITSEGQFVLGDRSLNFWVTAISAHASDMSGWLFMGLPAATFSHGAPKFWICLSLICGMFLSWHFAAPRLRVLSEQMQCLTLSTFFEKRFNDPSGTLRLISALFSVSFLTYYLSISMMTLGCLTESLFSLSYHKGIIAAGIIIILYTYIGGYTTIAWTDLFQGLFLLFAVILVPAIAFRSIDGFAAIEKMAASRHLSLNLLPTSQSGWLDIFFTFIEWAPGYFGMPHILIKFMGLKKPEEMSKCKYLGLSWQTLTLSAAAFTGLVGIAYFPNGLHDPQLIFIEMTKQLFPPFIASFILCAILAAIMSTMDAQILVVASVLSEDIYKRFLQRSPSSKNVLLFSRGSVIVVTALAIAIAWGRNASIMEATLYAWTGLACSYGPLLIASLYLPKSNRYGAIWGLLIGGTISAIWPTFNHFFFPSLLVPAMLPGFLLSLLSIYWISSLTAGKNKHAAG